MRSGAVRVTRLLVPLAALAASSAALAAQQLPQLPPSTEYGDYAVGVATAFAVDNRQRFDPWNAAYGRPQYRALLRRIEASGQVRTVVFQLWYPAAADSASGRLAGPRSPFPATSGRGANRYDFFFQDPAIALRATAAMIDPGAVHSADGGALAEAGGPARQATMEELAGRLADWPQGAWQDAWPAQGTFPLVLLAHGLGGNHGMWGSLGEFLASHGYIVAAPTFVSDGAPAMVFRDEDSPYAAQAGAGELRRASDLLSGEFKVVPYFFRLLFGYEGDGGFASLAAFDPSAAEAVPGGVERTTTMMRNLFRQRVSDVGLVLHTVRLLGEEREECAAALSAMGATSTARDHCGLLEGRVGGGPAGVAGHSLGSMTAQMAANHLPGVAAAAGFNNGPPLTWTPEEMLAGEETAGGLPGGARKPMLLVIGDEDAFVQRVFSGIFQSALAQAGGNPAEAFPLEAERAAPDRMENPQPVALSTWRRALSDRVLVTVRDVGHDVMVNDFARLLSWPAFQRGELLFGAAPRQRRRKPTGAEALAPRPAPGEPYTLLGWAAAGSADAYLPHVVRDWYVRAWFDWHLKGNQTARQRLADGDPFGDLTYVRSELK